MSFEDEYMIIRTRALGQVHVNENMQFNDIDADEVIIYEGIRARLFGNVNQRLVLKAGAKVFIHGKIKGEIINEGGRIYLYDI